MATRSNTSRQSGFFSLDGKAERSRRRDSEKSDVFSFHGEAERSMRRDSEKSDFFSFDGEADRSRRRDSEKSDFFSFDGEADRSRRRDSEKSDFFSFDGEAEQSRKDMDNSRLSSDQSFYLASPRTPRSPSAQLTPEPPTIKKPAPPIPRKSALEMMRELVESENARKTKASQGIPNEDQLDNGFFSPNITSLNSRNYVQTVAPLEKALVYFYDSTANRNTGLENIFSIAADTMNHPGYGFGILDCASEQRLCQSINIQQIPALKLFSNGFEVSTINKPQSFSADEMKRLMVMSPVLKKPRFEVGQDLMARARAKLATRPQPMTPTRPRKFCW